MVDYCSVGFYFASFLYYLDNSPSESVILPKNSCSEFLGNLRKSLLITVFTHGWKILTLQLML